MIQLKDFIKTSLRSFLKHRMKACLNCCLIIIIYTKRRNGYSLRGGDCLSVPRFETRFMKDSLAYRGTVLWNTICLNENGISHLSNKDRNLIPTKDYFKNFKFGTTSASTTRNINADFMYNFLVETFVVY